MRKEGCRRHSAASRWCEPGKHGGRTSDKSATQLTIHQVINLPTGGNVFEVRRIERAMNGVKTAIEDHTVALRILQIQNQARVTGQQQHGQQKLAKDAKSLVDSIVPPLGDSLHDNAANLMTIALDDLNLTFDPQTVRDPPTVSFAHDTDLLIREWHCSNRLIVAGQKIPI
jgi:hypothetical protein